MPIKRSAGGLAGGRAGGLAAEIANERLYWRRREFPGVAGAAAVAGCIYFLRAVKKDGSKPLVYAVVVSVLLAYSLWPLVPW